MCTAPTQTAAPKATLTKATSLLFHVAARSHSLRDIFGIEFHGDTEPLTLLRIHRPWLVPDWKGSTELTFEPDKFAKLLNCCSDGEHQMRLWILNVWNPGWAKEKGWHFDLFRALNSLDGENREAIAWWLQNPLWP